MKKVRTYSCMKCGGSVTKPPCVAPPKPVETTNSKGKKKKNKIEKIPYHGLGGWRCDNCGPTKVTVSLQEYNPNG